ncbi:hypothetical protein CHELA20_53945 [Hyphomicrobiales bacterium]|nr:hypothetical protein CHELA41_20982 [Hyphomicrobiales bacterium]CAH1685278.1 hypothetical protein CHELA20_53945 [Hyphomicrobiales bacterium]
MRGCTHFSRHTYATHPEGERCSPRPKIEALPATATCHGCRLTDTLATRAAVGVSYVYTTKTVNVVREQVYQGILATNTQFQKHTKSQAHKAAINGPTQYVLILTKEHRSTRHTSIDIKFIGNHL